VEYRSFFLWLHQAANPKSSDSVQLGYTHLLTLASATHLPAGSRLIGREGKREQLATSCSKIVKVLKVGPQ